MRGLSSWRSTSRSSSGRKPKADFHAAVDFTFLQTRCFSVIKVRWSWVCSELFLSTSGKIPGGRVGLLHFCKSQWSF